MTGRTEADGARVLRRALVGLGALSSAATAAELAMQRHWKSTEQLIPWVALGVLLAALVLVAVRPRRGRLLAGSALAVGVAGSTAYGVISHVRANLHAAPLDFRFEKTWSTMGTLDRWWTAFSGGVGPSPSLAPGALAVAAACLVLATLGHPALRRGDGRGSGAQEAA